MTLNDIQYLLAVDGIRNTKARYCRYMDTKQWGLMPDLFTADCHVEGFDSAPDGANASKLVEGLSNRFKDAISVHHCHMGEVEITGVGEARAIWAMEDFVEWPDNVPSTPTAPRGFYGYGHYEEAYRLTEGVWKIAHMRLTRLRIDLIPDSQDRPLPGRRRADPHWLESKR